MAVYTVLFITLETNFTWSSEIFDWTIRFLLCFKVAPCLERNTAGGVYPSTSSLDRKRRSDFFTETHATYLEIRCEHSVVVVYVHLLARSTIIDDELRHPITFLS